MMAIELQTQQRVKRVMYSMPALDDIAMSKMANSLQLVIYRGQQMLVSRVAPDKL
jgi:hypothetical protein